MNILRIGDWAIFTIAGITGLISLCMGEWQVLMWCIITMLQTHRLILLSGERND